MFCMTSGVRTKVDREQPVERPTPPPPAVEEEQLSAPLAHKVKRNHGPRVRITDVDHQMLAVDDTGAFRAVVATCLRLALLTSS